MLLMSARVVQKEQSCKITAPKRLELSTKKGERRMEGSLQYGNVWDSIGCSRLCSQLVPSVGLLLFSYYSSDGALVLHKDVQAEQLEKAGLIPGGLR